MDKSYPTIAYVSFFLLFFAFQVILSIQGFDVCDEGWYLSFYQQIFNNPESVEYNFVFWLTGIIGGNLYQVFPEGGILSFRILSGVMNTLTGILVWRILKPYLKSRYIFGGLLAILIVNSYGMLAFYYNYLSSFLAVCIIFLITRRSTKFGFVYTIFVGLITAVNIFSRLPNITLIGFALIYFWRFYKNSNIVQLRKNLLFYSIGFLLGLSIVWIVMYYLGHIDIFISSVGNLLRKGSNGSSNHNVLRMLLVYIKQYFSAFKFGTLSFLILLLVILSYKRVGLYKYLTLPILFVIYTFLFHKHAIEMCYFIACVSSIGLLVFSKYEDLKEITLLGLIMMVLLPLGSDGGFYNVGYMSLWVSLPLSTLFYKEHFTHLIDQVHRNAKQIPTIISIILIVAYFSAKLYSLSTNAYFDRGNRLEKTYKIDSRFSKGVYTTKNRASIINEVLPILKKYVREGDCLLAYDNIPMLNYLTNTKPYMGISWVWVYDSETFELKLGEAENREPNLPVIVQQRFQTISSFSEPMANYLSEEGDNSYIYNKERTISMNNFLKRNNYSIVWSNNYFNIYTIK